MVTSIKYVNYNGSSQSYRQGRNNYIITEQSPAKHKLTGFSDHFISGAPFGGSGIDKGSKRKKS